LLKFVLPCLFIICLFFSCHKEEEKNYCFESGHTLNSTVIGHKYDDDFVHLLTLDLGDEICIITLNAIRIFPYDTLKPSYQLNEDIGGVVVNQFDTIIQLQNSFYRFYPSSRTFEHIYTPPFSIFDFCVTPNHGIGYIWGNIFTEPPKFNYFDFRLNQNTTLFEYAKLIPNSNQPYYDYQTYVEGDSLKMLLNTGNVSNSAVGVFYSINLTEVKLVDAFPFSQKLQTKIIDFNDFKNLDIAYGLVGGGAELSTYNLKTGIGTNTYSIQKNAWYESEYFYDKNFLSISYLHLSGLENTEFINWRTGEKFFSIKTPEEYRDAFVGIRHFKDKMVVLFNQSLKTGIVYDQSSCIQHEITAKNNIQRVIYMDSLKIITLSDTDEVELFKL